MVVIGVRVHQRRRRIMQGCKLACDFGFSVDAKSPNLLTSQPVCCYVTLAAYTQLLLPFTCVHSQHSFALLPRVHAVLWSLQTALCCAVITGCSHFESLPTRLLSGAASSLMSVTTHTVSSVDSRVLSSTWSGSVPVLLQLAAQEITSMELPQPLAVISSTLCHAHCMPHCCVTTITAATAIRLTPAACTDIALSCCVCSTLCCMLCYPSHIC